MNIDELATNVARDIGSVRQRSCKRADGVEYHFEQSELEQFAKELITEYEKAAGSEPVAYRTWRETKMYGMWEYRTDELELNDDDWEPLYQRPDPRVAELEAEVVAQKAEWNKAYDIGVLAKHKIAELEAQNAALLVAIEAKDAAIEKIACIGNGDSHGNSIGNCMAIEALALSPSAELLGARDRKRDAKLLRIIEQRIQPQDSYQDDYFKAKVHSYNIVNELIKQRESGEWKPELGD